MKLCPRCKLSKPAEAFPKNRRKPDGLDSSCKVCTNARMRAKYASDPETRAKKIQQTRKYHLDHPEWSKERLRAHHVANRKPRAERAVLRGLIPEVRIARRDATRRAEQRRRATKASSTSIELITSADLKRKLNEYDNRCYICGTGFCSTIVMHWDHFQPLAKGGLHVLSNLRPACDLCNVRKNASWPVTEALLEEIKIAVLVLRDSVLTDGMEVHG